MKMKKLFKMVLMSAILFVGLVPTASADNSSFSLAVRGGAPSVYTGAVKKSDWESAVVNVQSGLGGAFSGVDMRIRTHKDYGNGREPATILVGARSNQKYYLSYLQGYGTVGQFYHLYMSRDGWGTNHISGRWAP